jgi:diguanylate cyclase (GGDEF)-like protein
VDGGGLAAALAGVDPTVAEQDWLAGLDAAARGALAGLLTRVRSAGAADAAAAGRARLEQLRRLAYTDLLTGLANRAGLQVAAAGVFAGSAGGRVGGLLVDLDAFKPVNDRYGHGVGDDVLAAAGRRLAVLGAATGGMAARLGGDEFALVLPALPGDAARAAAAVLAAADRVADELGRPYRVGGGLVDVGASVGAATVPAEGSLSALLAAADLAMYAAKHAGGGRARMTPDPGAAAADLIPAPRRPATRLRDHRRGEAATSQRPVGGAPLRVAG